MDNEPCNVEGSEEMLCCFLLVVWGGVSLLSLSFHWSSEHHAANTTLYNLTSVKVQYRRDDVCFYIFFSLSSFLFSFFSFLLLYFFLFLVLLPFYLSSLFSSSSSFSSSFYYYYYYYYYLFFLSKFFFPLFFLLQFHLSPTRIQPI